MSFKFKKLSAKIILLILLILSLSFIFSIFHQTKILTGAMLVEELNRAREMTVFCEQIRMFIGSLRSDGVFAGDRLLREAGADMAMGKAYSETDIYKTIPVVASWTAARARADELGYQFRIPKNQPRNPENKPRAGLEKAVVDYLEGRGSMEDITKTGAEIIWPDDPGAGGEEIGVLDTPDSDWNSRKTQYDGVKAVRFFKAIRLTRDCMTCHGEPAGSSDVLGFKKEGWSAGEIHGAFEIIIPLSLMKAEIDKAERNTIVYALFLFIAAGLIAAAFTRKVIGAPVEKMVSFVKDIGKGDFSKTVDVQSSDEIGDMAVHLNSSVSDIRKMVYRLMDTAGTLQRSSNELSSVSTDIARSAGDVSSQADAVAASAEEISSGVNTIALASDHSNKGLNEIVEMSRRMSETVEEVADLSNRTSEKVKGIAKSGGDMSEAVAGVASAVEEMTASLNEVAKNTVKAHDISNQAQRNAETVTDKMTHLSAASKRIGKIVNIIKDIADQTNMLALNAAIEASGAGEAGKGFGVVASEVKELARQSTDATGEISDQIENIQASITDALRSIEEINRIITENSNINQTIMAAVEEQTATASEISKNVASGAGMAQDVSRLVTDASGFVDDIASATLENSRSANDVTQKVVEISKEINDIAVSTNEASHGSRDISKNIQGVSLSSRKIAENSAAVEKSSADLAASSEKLNTIVRMFKAGDEKFDIASIKTAHISWRSKLEKALKGSMESDKSVFISERECKFGQWYFGPEGKAFENEPLYIKVGEHHRLLHEYAKRLLDLNGRGDKKGANEMMERFESERETFFKLLEDFYLS